MAANIASSKRVVRWEVLPGLPGEGPVPLHFHAGHPTPWAEGLVIRFWNEDESEWVGNFQGRQDWSTRILDWPEAETLVVLPMDNLYLFDARNPSEYITVPEDGFTLVDDVMFDNDHRFLFVAANTRVFGIGQDRRVAWTNEIIRGYDAQLLECSNGVLLVDVEQELGGARRTIRLSAKNGSLL